MDVKRIGKTNKYEVRVDGSFVAFVARAAYGKHIGAFWVVAVAPGRREVPGTFGSRAASLKALAESLV